MENFRREAMKSEITKLVIDAGPLKLSSSSIQIILQYADERLAKLLDCSPLSALVRIRSIRCDTKGFVVLALRTPSLSEATSFFIKSRKGTSTLRVQLRWYYQI